MHEVAQSGENTLRLHTGMLRIRYADLTQPVTQDETILGLCTLTNLVMRYPGFAVPLMFASNLLKGMINVILKNGCKNSHFRSC